VYGQKYNSTLNGSVHSAQGRNEGAQFPGRRITMGARRKVLTMSQVLSSIQHICFVKTWNSNTGTPNLLAPGAI